MKQQLILLRGLPGSGKSTWAKEQVAKSDGHIKRINKDDLRAMIDSGVFSKANEKQIIRTRDILTQTFLNAGHTVIIDDTNLAPEHQKAMERLANLHGVEFVINDSFLKVSIAECVERDSKRAKPVGKKVILKMAKQFQIPFYTPKEIYQRPDLPKVIICDLDGTLAIHNGRDPYDASKCETDLLNQPVHNLLSQYIENASYGQQIIIVFMSGRSDEFRPQTEAWLCKYEYGYLINDTNKAKLLFPLYMRKQGDSRPDYVIKKELFDEHIRDKFDVLFCLDDRDQIVKLWREELGLTCLQVNYGDF